MKKVRKRPIQFDPNKITDVEPMTEQEIPTDFSSDELSEENSGHIENANEVDMGDVQQEIVDHSNKTTGENTENEAENVEAETVEQEKVDEKTMALNGEFLLCMIDTAFPVAIKYGTEAVNVANSFSLDIITSAIAILIPSFVSISFTSSSSNSIIFSSPRLIE